MAEVSDEAVVLQVDSVDQIFNAPDIDPFAVGKGSILGEAALDLLLLQQQVQPRRDLATLPLVVSLPADQITPDLEPQLAAAIQRYCAARIEDNQLRIRHSRLQHSVGLAVVLCIVVAAILLVAVLMAVVFTDISALAQGMIAGALCVFSWVILWDPLEALLFEWVEPTRENRVFAQIQKMRVVVQAQE
ncbi:MAG: hypothetical protein R6W76_21195 [Caldilinea sp.]